MIVKHFLTTQSEFGNNKVTTEGIDDKDFNLSQSMTSVDIKKGDQLFSEAKDVFLDL